ncbi:hypothetical protein ACOME3_008926 [Neoechinorhynchus agilis]
MPTRSLYCQPAKVVIIECYSHEEMTAECFVQTVLKALIQLFETIDMHRPVKIEPNRKGSHKVLCQSIPLLSVHLVGQRAEQLMALDYVKPLVTSNVLRLKFQNVTSIVSGLSSPDMKPEDVKLLQLIRNTIAEFNTFSAMHRIQQENPRNKKDVMLLESADLHILSLRHLKYILNDVNQIGFDHMSNIKQSGSFNAPQNISGRNSNSYS